MARAYDIAIVGGGLIGLATASKLLLRRPGISIALLEKEATVAAHQSGHNSGVVHSGLYYEPGGVNVRFCRAGRLELIRYASERGIPFKRCGKLVVAVDPDELPRLADLRSRGLANGLEGLEEIPQARISEFEPWIRGLGALWIPETGIIDYAQVARAMSEDLRAAGVDIFFGHRVTSIEARRDVAIHTTRGIVTAGNLVVCGGLCADRLAAMTGHEGRDRVVAFRGDYYSLRQPHRAKVRGLVYPVPDPSLPFGALGVHFTRTVGDEVWAGPSATLAFAREGYTRYALNPRDLADTLAFGGFWRLMRRDGKLGMQELWRDYVKGAFVRQLKRYMPTLEAAHLRFGPSGVRAQPIRPDGTLLDDFSVGAGPHVMHVRAIPSPGATAAFAIADELASRAVSHFELN